MYNDDYENEEIEEEYDEEYVDSDYEFENPPHSNNLFYNARNSLKNAGSHLAKNVSNTFWGGLKNLTLFFIKNPIFWIILLFLVAVAIIWLVLSEETNRKVTKSVENYILNSETIDSTAKALYVDRHSLLLLKISEINEMYDAFIEDDSIAGDIKTAMKTKVGNNDVENKKATQYGTSTSYGTNSYDINFVADAADGIRNTERVKMITGSAAPISTYKVNGMYTLENGMIGGLKVEIVDVTIPVWRGEYGSQVASTTTIKVNSKIKDIAVAMFKDIYNDPSKPVINSIGGFRSSDDCPTHPFGVSFDINPDENPMPGSYGDIANYKPGTNKLSMDANHPIVKIICGKYGWDWGGSWSYPQDYMHFSFIGG